MPVKAFPAFQPLGERKATMRGWGLARCNEGLGAASERKRARRGAEYTGAILFAPALSESISGRDARVCPFVAVDSVYNTPTCCSTRSGFPARVIAMAVNVQ